MMTLKEYLEKSNVFISSKERCKLGLIIVNLYNDKKKGNKITKIEDGCVVRVYPIKFLEMKSVSNRLIKFLNS